MSNENDNEVRPGAMADFIGQDHFKANLQVFVASAKAQDKPLDHVLLYGRPPGLGKTTLAQIIAAEMGVKPHFAMAPSLQKLNDLIVLFGQINHHDIVFLDEIHRLTGTMAEFLYPLMEDFKCNISYGEGRNKKSIVATVAPFTLIGATTRAGMLPQPLRDRFGIHLKLALYEPAQLAIVLSKAAERLGMVIDSKGAAEIAARARGTPRIALQLMRRCHDFAIVAGQASISAELADYSLSQLGIDSDGLNDEDRRYLKTLAESFGGGPAGVDPIAASMGDDRDNVEDVIEPYLIQAGFVRRTAQGRMLSEKMLSKYIKGISFAAK